MAEWLKNVVEGAEATGHPLEHVFFEEVEHFSMHMRQNNSAWATLGSAEAALGDLLSAFPP